MKKTKLLTSLAALALVLGLGACTEIEDTSTSSGATDETTDTTSETTETTPSTGEATVENYTLSFTFTLEESPATVESYESLYIAGDFNEWGFDILTENEGAYEITIPSIAVGEHSYKVLLAYTGSPDWNNEIIPVLEDNANATFTVAEGDTGYALEWELTQAFGEYLTEITTRTDFVVNFYFTDGTTYYSIPSYADAYLAGGFTGGESWDNPTVGSDTYKLVANGETAEEGYSVTFSSIVVSTISYNMYFVYNSSAVNHNTSTAIDWDVKVSSSDLSMTIPALGDSIDIILNADPSTIIGDSADFCYLRVAINDTSSSAQKTILISGNFNSWGTSTSFTYDTSKEGYQYYYDFTNLDKGSQFTFGIFTNTSSWNDRLYPSNGSDLWADNDKNFVLAASETNYDYTLLVIIADCSQFGGSAHFQCTSYSITHPTGF